MRDSTRRPVLLDTDPGVDDALAIILAVRSAKFEVKAITVSAGNVGVDQCAANALLTLQVLGCDPMPIVARGACRPVRRSPFRAQGIHGVDGLGGATQEYSETLRAAWRHLDQRDAIDVILEQARGHDPGELTIIATAPLTNLALAISKDPEAMRRVGHVVWMGGAYATHGNITPVAEFNAFCDPDAAQEVLSFGVPMTVVGLDAAMQCPLTRAELAACHETQAGNPVAHFAWRICQGYMDFYLKHEGADLCFLHDPLAVAVAAWPEVVTRAESHHVHVVTEPGPAYFPHLLNHPGSTWGMTVIDRRPRNPWTNQACCEAHQMVPAVSRETLESFGSLQAKPHVSVVMSVDGKSVARHLLQSLASA